jgi:hypothetical protein
LWLALVLLAQEQQALVLHQELLMCVPCRGLGLLLLLLLQLLLLSLLLR